MIKCDHCQEEQEDSTTYIKLTDRYPKETVICKKCMRYWREQLELPEDDD